jgi:teichuronic acid biosynthesis glycosyltransferase TuaC
MDTGLDMHLVLLSSQFPTPNDPNGGVFTAQLVDALAKRVDVTVVCPTPYCPNLPVLRDLGTCKWYAGIPRETRRNHVQVHHPRFPFLPKLSHYFQPAFQALPLRWHLQQINKKKPIDAINAHWMFPDAVAGTWAAQSMGLPILVTALGSDINSNASSTIRKSQIRWTLKHATATSGVSRALVERMVEWGADAATSTMIANGVDRTRFSPADDERVVALRRERGLDPAKKHLVFVGRLHPVKGLRHLIKALHLLKLDHALHFHTVLVGDGEERGIVTKMIGDFGLTDAVTLAGEVAHTDVPAWLQVADVFCLPSLSEGMPNVVLEAQACGTPVVASNVGALPDIVSSDCGILVPAGDARSLAGALADAFQRPWNRQAIAASPLTQSWDNVAAQYLSVIRGITNGQVDNVNKSSVYL